MANDPVTDVDVVWYCETCSGAVIGSDATDDVGRYDINEPQSTWDEHDGHDLEGMASKTGYHNAYRNIYGFDASSVYQRDFEMIEE